MAKNFFILTFSLLTTLPSMAQMQLSNFYPRSASYQDTVYIVGKGFGTDPANIVVHLGAGRATLLSVEDQFMKVLVPNTASFGHVSVTELSTASNAFFDVPFVPVYQAENFDFSHVSNASKIISEESGLYDICNCDFDNDGDLDIATVNNTDAAKLTSVNVFSNTSTDPGNVTFVKVPGTYFNINQPARNVSCQDINGDGKPELLVTQGGDVAENIYIFKNTSTTSPAVISFASPTVISADFEGPTNGTRRIKVHDLDGDNRPEIIISNQTAENLIIFKNESDAANLSFPAEKRKIIAIPSTTLGLEVNDIDGDRHADIILSSNLSGNFYVVRNTSEAGVLDFATAVTFSLSGQLVNIASGDIDGDGKQDLVLTDFEDGAILLLLNQSSVANIAFASPIRMNAALQPWGIKLADISGNQQPDIIVATLAGSDKVVILKNNSVPGDPNFELIQAGLASKYRNLEIADFNMDAKPDIITTEEDAFGGFYVTYIQNNSCVKAVVKPESPPAICEASPVTLFATPTLNATYQWLKDGNPIPGADQPSYEASAGGNYAVKISDINLGCVSTSAAVSLVEDSGTIPNVPAITAPATICEGNALTLSAASVDGLSYQWTGPDGFVSDQISPVISNVSQMNAGVYLLEVKQGLCKSATKSVFVDVIPTPTIEFVQEGPLVICPGEEITLNFNADEMSGIAWYRDNILIDGETSNSLTTSSAGAYTVTALNSSSCRLSSEVLIIQEIPLEASFSSDLDAACIGVPITFSSASMIPTDTDISYYWDFDDGTTSFDTNPLHTYTEPGTYAVRLVVDVNDGACSSEATQTIQIHPRPMAQFVNSADYLCPGDTLSLDISGEFTSVIWEDGSDSRLRFIASGGTYTALLSNEFGCDTTISIDIEEKILPELFLEASENSIARGDSVQLYASGADFYQWSPANSLSDSTASSVYAKPLNTTTYTLTGYDADGCSTSTEITISVNIEEVPVDALDIFSPNGDGIDDQWVINNFDQFPECYFLIFDMQGREVFRSAAPYLNDWEGTDHSGSPLAPGTYFYVVRCTDKLNKASGSISITR
jgi:gliding motility-associated-like protein